MAKPYEQDVILDADGKPLFDAMTILERRIANIGKTINKISQDSFKTANNLNKTIDANVKALNKAQSQMNALSKIGATDRNVDRTLARTIAQRDAARYGTNSTRVGYELELQKKLDALEVASTERQKRAALEAVKTAQARLNAIQQIERAEARIANETRRTNAGDALSGHRQRMALSRQYGEQQLKQLGNERALADAKNRVLAAETKLANANSITRDGLRRNLELEQARERAIQRIIRAQERANKPAAGNPMQGPNPKGPESRLSNILSPGYAAAAFARTSVYGAAAMAAYGTFNAVTQGISGVVQLEDELAKLQAIAGATDIQMKSLRGTIFEIGRDSRFSVNELAKISQVLAQAGISSGQMPDVLRSVTRLATSSGSTPDESVQLLTSALGSFQLQGSEAARVADLMTEALNRTKLTVQQVGQAIQYVGATAYEQNISLEQMLATVGAVAQAGVKSGSTIGTGFRQFLVDLADPSKKLNEQLTLLGLSASDVDVKVRGLPAVLDTLKEAGFGASQAYEGLEVRAAAFYLTAKNNIDVIDRLQLGFTQQGASIKANEIAMSSLTAQWQRFKNILQEGLFNSLEGPMEVLKLTLKNISDAIEDMRDAAEELDKRRTKVQAGTASFGEQLKWFDQMISQYIGQTAEKGFQKMFDLGEGQNYGTLIVKGSMDATDASEKLENQISETNDKIDQQRSKVAELDKELIRLITQKESLRDNETRTAAETATLSQRFDGLALNLRSTGNAYDDLVQAMIQYRNQQSLLLGTDLLAQSANLTLQTAKARTNSRVSAQALLRDPGFAAQINDPAVMQALIDVRDKVPGSQGYNNAQAILSDAVRRLSSSNAVVAERLNKVVQSVGTVAYNTQVLRAVDLEAGNIRASNTDVGKMVLNGFREVEAGIAQLGSLENGTDTKNKAANSALSILNRVDAEIARRLKMTQSEWSRRFLAEAQVNSRSLRQQIKALTSPTSEEKKAADRATRSAEREAERGPLLTQKELDDTLLRFTGLSLGSGVRSAAEQNALFRAGKTRATAATSSHSNGGLARDIPIPDNITDAQARSMVAALRQHFKNLGVDVHVEFETGKGKYQGTGRHIHANARKGTRWQGSAAGSDAAAMDAFENAQDAAQLNLDKRELSEALKDISKATTPELYAAAKLRAEAAMKKVTEGLTTAAMNDLEKGGIGPGMPQYQERMARLSDEIGQLSDEYNRKVTDALIKGSQAMLKAAQEAFEAALKPSQSQLAVAEGVVAGLGYASNQGKVPDYTMAIAQQQAARAKEAADRARMEALPGMMDATRGQMSDLVLSLTSGQLDEDGVARVKDQILALSNSLADLEAQYASLKAAFGAEGLIPTTFREGLQQAIEAYRELNGLGNTFTQQVNNELTGAISAVHSGLTEMFSGVLSGSVTAGQAIMGFARAVMQAITQIVAKLIATQIINLLLSLVGSIGGATMSSGAGVGTGTSGLGISGPSFSPVPVNVFNGGPMGYALGGHVSNGHSMRDSVFAKLSKGEWVINKRAVDSVGHEFMNDLNNRGSKALENTQSVPKLEVKPQQKVNVWMVKPDEMPSMGPDDVIVTWQKDVLQGGQSKKLIESIARESR